MATEGAASRASFGRRMLQVGEMQDRGTPQGWGVPKPQLGVWESPPAERAALAHSAWRGWAGGVWQGPGPVLGCAVPINTITSSCS